MQDEKPTTNSSNESMYNDSRDYLISDEEYAERINKLYIPDTTFKDSKERTENARN